MGKKYLQIEYFEVQMKKLGIKRDNYFYEQIIKDSGFLTKDKNPFAITFSPQNINLNIFKKLMTYIFLVYSQSRNTTIKKLCSVQLLGVGNFYISLFNSSTSAKYVQRFINKYYKKII